MQNLSLSQNLLSKHTFLRFNIEPIECERNGLRFSLQYKYSYQGIFISTSLTETVIHA